MAEAGASRPGSLSGAGQLEDEDDPVVIVRTGSVELVDEEHGPHCYLYVPDLSSQTGWGAHRVPLGPDPAPRRRVGFARD